VIGDAGQETCDTPPAAAAEDADTVDEVPCCVCIEEADALFSTGALMKLLD
jgi:hypothetical protein